MLFRVLFFSEIMLECWGAAYTRVRLIHESLRYNTCGQPTDLDEHMALSHKNWELPNSRIWLAEMDIDHGLDFPI